MAPRFFRQWAGIHHRQMAQNRAVNIHQRGSQVTYHFEFCEVRIIGKQGDYIFRNVDDAGVPDDQLARRPGELVLVALHPLTAQPEGERSKLTGLFEVFGNPSALSVERPSEIPHERLKEPLAGFSGGSFQNAAKSHILIQTLQGKVDHIWHTRRLSGNQSRSGFYYCGWQCKTRFKVSNAIMPHQVGGFDQRVNLSKTERRGLCRDAQQAKQHEEKVLGRSLEERIGIKWLKYSQLVSSFRLRLCKIHI